MLHDAQDWQDQADTVTLPVSDLVASADVMASKVDIFRNAICAGALGNYAVRMPADSTQSDSKLLDQYAAAFNATVEAIGIIHALVARGRAASDADFERVVGLLRFSDATSAAISDRLLRLELGDRSRMPTEERYKSVYGACPPTLTHFSNDAARGQYANAIQDRLEVTWGLPLARLPGARLLDAGCGSCDKTIFYADLGADVVGIDVTPEVLDLARTVIAGRRISLAQKSVFELDQSDGEFDIIIADGVLHHTNDTKAAFDCLVGRLKPGGFIAISLVNVWSHLWWFEFGRLLTKFVAGPDYHLRARWGARLFSAIRHRHENTSATSSSFRSMSSWAYDWFASPHWNLHRPGQIISWLAEHDLEYVKATPSLIPDAYSDARGALQVFGKDSWFKAPEVYWLANEEWHSMFFTAHRPAT